MYEIITKEQIPEYEAFVQSHPKGNFAQSWLWSKQKPMWDWDAVAVRGEDGKIKGTMALMTRKVPGIGRTLMYGCRAPVCDLDDRETFAQLLEGQGSREAEKGLRHQDRPGRALVRHGLCRDAEELRLPGQGGRQNFEAIQPRYVFRLNIAGKTEDEIMAGFHQKWRYNIRLAARKGVTVKKVCGKEMVPAFAELMLTTGVRDGFVTRKPEYFSAMLDNLGEHARLYMAFDPEGRRSQERSRSGTATRSGICTARRATSTGI